MVQSGDADVVTVYRWSRFGRTSLDYRVDMDFVKQAGGQLESAVEEVDPRSSAGRFQRGLMIEIAASASQRIGDQWREAHARRRAPSGPVQARTLREQWPVLPVATRRGMIAELFELVVVPVTSPWRWLRRLPDAP